MEGEPQIGRGIMAADGLLRRAGGGDLSDHHRIIGRDAGKVHHLAKPDDRRPTHRLGDIVRAEHRAALLQAWRRGHAGRHLDPDIDRLGERLVMHQTNALQAEYIGDLMGIDEHRGRAMGNDGAAELRHRHHAAFHMHMGVAETWHDVAALGLDHLRVGADRVGGIRPAIGKAPRADRDVRAGNDLAGMNVHPAGTTHDEIGRLPAHRHIDELS